MLAIKRGRNQMTPKPVILVMYSGGLDSVGMLYKLLTDPEYTEYTIHVHHIHIENLENRTQAEKAAVQDTLKELHSHGLRFGYSENHIESPAFNRGNGNAVIMHDWDIVRFHAGWIACVNPEIKHIAIGREKSNVEIYDDVEKLEKSDQLVKYFTDSATMIYPMAHMDKREIYASLPDWLTDKFWSCRHPVYHAGVTKPCGVCATCQTLARNGLVQPVR
jgi:7-cyano-7-deazaguanine synthase in queuosine biosynthesis